MEKPIIIVFSTSYYPFMGGAEVAIQEVARRLSPRFDFYVVAARLKRGLLTQEVRPEGIIMRTGAGIGLDKLLFPVFGAIKGYFLIKKNLSSRKVVLWGMDISHGALAASFLAFLFPRIPFIFTIQYGYGGSRMAKGRLGVINLSFRWILRRASSVTVISRYLLERSRAYGYRGKVKVIHNGVDDKIFGKIKSVPQPGNVVITTSRLVEKNGIDVLLDAIAIVKKKIPDIQCRIVGEGPLKKELEARTEKLEIGGSVRFFGGVPYEKIPELLAQSSVFVRPSRSEGMGNSFVEALAAGIPIIGTPVEGILDIIEDGETGLFCRTNDAQDLSEKIITLLSDKDLAGKIVEKGKVMVSRYFSWPAIAEEYGVIFSKLPVRPMRIAIATPLLPPRLGGPGQVAENLNSNFIALGQFCETVSFGSFLRFPSGIRHFLYFLALLRIAGKSDIILALDFVSVGLPAAIISKILRKPLIIRVEGDFVWETFVERARKDITLKEFYGRPQNLSGKERVLFWVSSRVLRRAGALVFSSEWRKKMVADKFNLAPNRTFIISGVWSLNGPPQKAERRNIVVWAGRMIYLKNLERLLRVFAKINFPEFKLHLYGEGKEKNRLRNLVDTEKISGVAFYPPLSREEMTKTLGSARFLVLPSISEVGPQIIGECISLKTPFLMTKESGYKEYLEEVGLFCEPRNEKDIEEKMRIMFNSEKYREIERRVNSFRLRRSWKDAAEEWLGLMQKVLGSA